MSVSTPIGSTSLPAGPQREAYAGSVALEKLTSCLDAGQPLRLACLDIDSTLTGAPALADAVRVRLEELGYVIIFDTSRTEEMIMSSAAYEATRNAGYLHRPPPHLAHAGNRWVYAPPETVEPRGVLDGDIISASTGTRIYVRQTDGPYRPDPSYERYAPLPHNIWRAACFHFLHELRRRGYHIDPASIEYEDSYQTGRSDIFPPDYRMQLNFDTREQKLDFARGFRLLRRESLSAANTWTEIARDLRLTDDSRPETGGYKMFVTPRNLSKARAIEHVVASLCRTLGIIRSDLSLFVAGDSFPDLAMGLLGGLGVNATFLLAGESRLADSLTAPGVADFTGEPTGAIRRRLTPLDSPGHYRFRVPLSAGACRRLIVGDEAFPSTREVETVYRYVDGLSAGH